MVMRKRKGRSRRLLMVREKKEKEIMIQIRRCFKDGDVDGIDKDDT